MKVGSDPEATSTATHHRTPASSTTASTSAAPNTPDPSSSIPAGPVEVTTAPGRPSAAVDTTAAVTETPACADTTSNQMSVARAGAAVVSAPGVGVLGMANDGGFWIVALSAGGPEDFEGVPMSDANTGALQLERLIERGHRVELVESLTDVDSWDEARVVARAAPTGRFATEVERVAARLG